MYTIASHMSRQPFMQSVNFVRFFGIFFTNGAGKHISGNLAMCYLFKLGFNSSILWLNALDAHPCACVDG